MVLSPKLTSLLLGGLGWLWHRNLMELSAFVLISKPLNESVLREVYPLPRVDEILAQLSRSKVFSKLDANSGF